ncbi:hypothetical protein [Mycobacterium sp. QGD 101]|uniref:hypothetical protein n=1 Tax=Mycobacterium hubeiense TaxID=1867256 RepID=UPI001E40CC5D
MDDKPRPWWMDDPELLEIRRRTLEEIETAGEQRDLIDTDAPDAVVADFYSGDSWRELAAAREDLARARERYDEAVRKARAVGFSWGEIGRVLGLSKQSLHRRFTR